MKHDKGVELKLAETRWYRRDLELWKGSCEAAFARMPNKFGAVLLLHSQVVKEGRSPWVLIGTNAEMWDGSSWKWLGHSGAKFIPTAKPVLADVLTDPRLKWFTLPGSTTRVAKVSSFMHLLGHATGHVGVKCEQWNADMAADGFTGRCIRPIGPPRGRGRGRGRLRLVRYSPGQTPWVANKQVLTWIYHHS